MSIEKWQAHIKAYDSSVMSKAAYAKAHNLDYNQFLYWCKKHEQSSYKESDLIEVKMPKSHSDTNELGRAMGVMEYPNGVKLHIHHPSLLKMLPDWRA